MFLLSDDRIDRAVSRRGWYLLGGIILLALAIRLPAGLKIGVFTGFQLISLGLYSLCFWKWRTDRGIWMLALFLALLFGPIWIAFEYSHFESIFVTPLVNARQPFANAPREAAAGEKLRFAIDTTVALLIFAHIIRLAFSVAVRNWQITRSPAPM